MSSGDEVIDCSLFTNEDAALEVAKKNGYKLCYKQFATLSNPINLTYYIWNTYCIITQSGRTRPTVLKQNKIDREIIQSFWGKKMVGVYFVEEYLYQILFQFWGDSSDTINTMVDYVFHTYGPSLDYDTFLSLDDVPFELYEWYRKRQILNSGEQAFNRDMQHYYPIPPRIQNRYYLKPKSQSEYKYIDFYGLQDALETQQAQNKTIRDIPLLILMRYFIKAINHTPRNPTLYDDKGYNGLI